MGKYMKKAKITGDIALMEVSQSSLGVRTRAKTLALQRLQSTAQQSPEAEPTSYLQLRSRRLEKPPSKPQQKKEEEETKENSKAKSPKKSNPRSNSRLNSDSVGSNCSKYQLGCFDEGLQASGGSKDDEQIENVEASFGENNLDFDGRERSTRESTPCSLIRSSDTIETPGSTTKPAPSPANRRARTSMQRNTPTQHEMDEFFVGAEKVQQRIFIEKYNFDIINDLPLPGRFEWVQVAP
ncbi:Cyclin-dependent kinase inhibitor domain [Dillenia turbinata]|uniref:Cyclin-dependent kinase inhibitor domain n=1 Tax=Dillenia turbinata TaxID=194707 RepID=A0AAN8VUY6_9MAGN